MTIAETRPEGRLRPRHQDKQGTWRRANGPGSTRWLEHAAWVAFEDVFLIVSCQRSIVELMGSPGRLIQVLSNLVINAVDA